jgi:hypothetical protein
VFHQKEEKRREEKRSEEKRRLFSGDQECHEFNQTLDTLWGYLLPLVIYGLNSLRSGSGEIRTLGWLVQ